MDTVDTLPYDLGAADIPPEQTDDESPSRSVEDRRLEYQGKGQVTKPLPANPPSPESFNNKTPEAFTPDKERSLEDSSVARAPIYSCRLFTVAFYINACVYIGTSGLYRVIYNGFGVPAYIC